MLFNISKLMGWRLSAKDGEIGKITDIYFDDRSWQIRYFIVETGNWLFGRKVLIAPYAVTGVVAADKLLAVGMNKEQIRNSPDIDTDRPVSRQMEAALFDHYSWPYYGGAGMGYPTTGMVEGASKFANSQSSDGDADIHLRSYSHVSDYMVHNEDGFIGNVFDFVTSDEDWRIPFLIIDTHNWASGDMTYAPTYRISSIDWHTHEVRVGLSTQVLRDSPKYGHQDALSEAFSHDLYKYYPML